MKNFITINGKQTELTETQLKQLGIIVDDKPKWDDFGKLQGAYVSGTSTVKLFDYVSKYNNKNIFPTEQEAEACLALSQLCQWRDKYNNGWIVDWKDNELKFTIKFTNEEINPQSIYYSRTVLAFRDRSVRDKFIIDFKELIETAKPLL